MSKDSEEVTKHFDSCANFFNQTSEGIIYGLGHNLVTRLVNQHLRRSILERFRRTMEGCLPYQGQTILDIGCGPGIYSIELAKGGAHITGIDFAIAMVRLAQKRAEEHPVSNCNFVVADFFSPPFPKNHKFNYTIAMGIMDYISNPKSFIKTMLSVTQKKAFISFPLAGGFLAWQRSFRYRLSHCPLFLYTENQVGDLFNGLTYERLEVERIFRDLFVTVFVGE